jgi:hypothetical protein
MTNKKNPRPTQQRVRGFDIKGKTNDRSTHSKSKQSVCTTNTHNTTVAQFNNALPHLLNRRAAYRSHVGLL